MKPSRTFVTRALIAVLCAFGGGLLMGQAVVKEAGSGPLLFSGQFFSPAAQGELDREIDDVISAIQKFLSASGSRPEELVRLHIAVTSTEVEEAAKKRFVTAFPGVPFTWVVSELPRPGARITADCIARTEEGGGAAPSGKVLPRGVRYFVSGQAAREEGLAAATRGTMEQLKQTLKQYGLSLSDSVQIKSFLNPMTEVETARREIESFFENGDVPPLVFVEWESSLPIEIELIASDGSSNSHAEAMEFLTPQGMTSSPVFCRVVRVNDAPLLFVSGLNGNPTQSSSDQVRGIFSDLKSGLEANGSDLRHLAKATYYVANPEVSKALNELRPDYYDPERPPSASKAMVAGGGGGSAITIDMIAVKPR